VKNHFSGGNRSVEPKARFPPDPLPRKGVFSKRSPVMTGFIVNDIINFTLH
jgi:hypothetical protein